MAEGNREQQRVARLNSWLLLILPAVAIAVLARSPVGRLPTAAATLEATVLELGRLATLVLAGYVLSTHVLYTYAVLTRTSWLADALRPITLPMIRRAAASLAAFAITLSAAVPSAIASGAERPVATAHIDLSSDATPTPVLERIEPIVDDQTGVIARPEIGSYAAPLVWLVRPGDNLWTISEEHLTIVLNRKPTRDEHRKYWVQVKDSARRVIRSGNVDLIYPGEQIPLPPTLNAGIRR